MGSGAGKDGQFEREEGLQVAAAQTVLLLFALIKPRRNVPGCSP